MFAHVSADTAAGLLQTFGVPELMENEDHIQVKLFFSIKCCNLIEQFFIC